MRPSRRFALAALARSPDARIARLARQAQTTTSRYDMDQTGVPPRTPTIEAWPKGRRLPPSFSAPVASGDPRYACGQSDGCIATMRDLNGADELRGRRAQHLVGDQRRRDLPPLGGPVDDFLDDAGAGIGIDPDVHGDLQLR